MGLSVPRTAVGVGAEVGVRVCRVRPDVPALEREFDYLVPDAMAAAVTLGTIVRVPLAGRRVRGWVVADGVAPGTEVERLLPLAKVVGAGPPPDVLELCTWAAWRWAGPTAALLRAASAPNAVRSGPSPVRVAATDGPADAGTAPADPWVRELLAWPPAADRRDLVADRIAAIGLDAGRRPGHRCDSRRCAGASCATGTGCSSSAVPSLPPPAPGPGPKPDAGAASSSAAGPRSGPRCPISPRSSCSTRATRRCRRSATPTWNGRDVAVERARRSGARAHAGRRSRRRSRPRRSRVRRRGPTASAERAGWPIVEVVDPREEPPGTGLAHRSRSRRPCTAPSTRAAARCAC